MIKINLDNKAHQSILVHIALIYWSAGDAKGVYEDPDLLREIEEGFGVSGMKDVEKFLDETEEYWEDWGNLKMMPNSNHMDEDERDKEPIYETLPVEDFINERERIIFRKEGQDYIIYGPRSTGEDGYSIFKALPEDQCGSDDDPDMEFSTYKELWEWAENAGGPNLS